VRFPAEISLGRYAICSTEDAVPYCFTARASLSVANQLDYKPESAERDEKGKLLSEEFAINNIFMQQVYMQEFVSAEER
jgi:hypothetical protein